MNKTVTIIGGGIAGINCANILASFGINVILIEKENEIGGKLNKWHKLFPNFEDAQQLLANIKNNIENNEKIKILTNTIVNDIKKQNNKFIIQTNTNKTIESDALVLSTGYDLFDARIKEEYGYGIYENIITSAELEEMFKKKEIKLKHNNKDPRRIGFVHCVGSRDKKINVIYCSRICCVTAVKQAIEVRKLLPFSEAYCFYMDLRMYDLPFEELYNESQEKYNITFIRGRVSEVSKDHENKIIVKVEDTLLGRPLRMSLDLLVLMVGFIASKDTIKIAKALNLTLNTNNFILPLNEQINSNATNTEGVFVTGTVTSPKSIDHTITDSKACALSVIKYIKNL
ncbi:MAG: FAD-dependent oxidoreductase [Bacteroidales bacterium]|nr:FAD-dependent oxidoreductase [Bacteroidales bacterium]